MRAAVFLLIAPLLAAQDQKCTIEGTVLNGKTNEPIKKVEVLLRREDSSGGVTNGVLTDGAGKFKFVDLQPARYDIWMSKSGFLEGPRRLGDASHVLALAAGQTLKDLTYRLWPTAVIAGRVVDEDGSPMTDVSIMAFRYRYEQGRPRVSLDGGVAQTDDQGHYRMYGLSAGRWYLGAKHMKAASHSMGDATGFHFTDSARDEAYATLYYPGVTDAGQSAPIQLRAGEERRDVDFRLVPARTVRVRGRVAPLPPPQELSVLLMARGLTGPTPLVEHRLAGVDEKGAFEIRGVFPGSYLLLSMPFRLDEGPSARQRLEVGDTDVNDVEVTLRPTVKVKGRVQIEGDASSGLKPDNVYVVLTQEDALFLDRANGEAAEADGSFTLSKLAPGEYRVNVSRIPQGCYLKAVTYGGVDALAKGASIGEGAGTLDVLLSPNGGSVDGTVTGDDDKPAIGATVVLVPEAKRPDLYQTGTTDQNGRFTIRGVAPGSYQLYAWDYLEPGAYEDPAFLEPYRNQVKTVTVEEKSRVTQDLPLLHATEE
jgi:hypothetical protein